MLKKHMTPIGVHRKGSLHSSPNKGSSQRHLPSAAGGVPNIQSYAKATPMAQSDQPATPPDGLDPSSFGGVIGS